ncbi:hypothetical protein QUF63_16645 [Anaerolineales bacterium HSG25]|nr:hypothetical protein [Anaerolineales bacterium HSG25]
MKKLEIIGLSLAFIGLIMTIFLVIFQTVIVGFVMLFGSIAALVFAIGSGIGLIVLAGSSGLALSWGMERLRQQRELTAQLRLQNQQSQLATRRDELQLLLELRNSLQVMQVLKSGESLVTNQPNLHLLTGPTPVVMSAGVGNASAPMTGQDNEALAYTTDPNWIHNFLFDEQNKLKVYHVKLDGPTGVGKTHLMLHIISLLQQPHPAAEYWLCDPKFEGESSGWPFEPFVTDFEDVATGAQYLYDRVVTARKHAKRNDNPPQHPAFLLFDEADGCFDEHGEAFTRPIRRIIKEGRSGWAHCFLAGQSPLAKDVGLSGSLFRNMVRFVFGMEALAFLRNPQFGHWDKSDRTRWGKQLQHLQEQKIRGCLAIPASGQGKPFVAEIPHLPRPQFVNLVETGECANDECANNETPDVEGFGNLQHLNNGSQNGNGHARNLSMSKGVSMSKEEPDPQFQADLLKVCANIDRVRFRKGKPVRSSICKILGIPDGGREYPRARAVAEYLEKQKD